MLKFFHPHFGAFAAHLLLLGLTTATAANAQTTAVPEPASGAEAAAMGNKAAKPPVDAAASQANVATKKPAKAGAQAGPVAASGADVADSKAAKGNKAGKPPVDAAASQADVATKKPAKAGAQSGPVAASAPQR
jgi:hypothetical protein